MNQNEDPKVHPGGDRGTRKRKALHGLKGDILLRDLTSEMPTSTPLLSPQKASLQAEYTESTMVFSQNQRKDGWRSDVKGGRHFPSTGRSQARWKCTAWEGSWGISAWAVGHQHRAQLLSHCHFWHACLVLDLSLHSWGTWRKLSHHPPKLTGRGWPLQRAPEVMSRMEDRSQRARNTTHRGLLQPPDLGPWF